MPSAPTGDGSDQAALSNDDTDTVWNVHADGRLLFWVPLLISKKKQLIPRPPRLMGALFITAFTNEKDRPRQAATDPQMTDTCLWCGCGTRREREAYLGIPRW